MSLQRNSDDSKHLVRSCANERTVDCVVAALKETRQPRIPHPVKKLPGGGRG